LSGRIFTFPRSIERKCMLYDPLMFDYETLRSQRANSVQGTRVRRDRDGFTICDGVALSLQDTSLLWHRAGDCSMGHRFVPADLQDSEGVISTPGSAAGVGRLGVDDGRSALRSRRF
jgi:hypothetical protein